MNFYIAETEYAAQNLLELALREEMALKECREKFGVVNSEFQAHRWDFETSDVNDDFSDRYIMGAHARMANAGRKAMELQTEMARLRQLITTRVAAIQALVGAILQIAKQGISIVHGARENAPPGRIIGSVPLRDVIWYGRNQALHFEEPAKPPTARCFKALAADFGDVFLLERHPGQSRAKEVLNLLGWSTYQNYVEDMQSLLRE